jgi:hypothetical protein
VMRMVVAAAIVIVNSLLRLVIGNHHVPCDRVKLRVWGWTTCIIRLPNQVPVCIRRGVFGGQLQKYISTKWGRGMCAHATLGIERGGQGRGAAHSTEWGGRGGAAPARFCNFGRTSAANVVSRLAGSNQCNAL